MLESCAFQDVSNRTPSPGDAQDSLARRHSPWTAARLRKKTRAAPPTPKLPTGLDSGCSSGYSSPETCVKTSPYAGDDPIAFHFEAAVTLHSPATPGSKRGSAHSSPALNRHEHSEQHPAKAFIVSNEEQGMGQPGEQQQQLFGGSERASVSPEGGRRAVWLGSQQQAEAGADEDVAPRSLEHSLSCPDAALHQQHQQQQQAMVAAGPGSGRSRSFDAPCPPAPMGRRSVTVRRKSWLSSSLNALGSGLNTSFDSQDQQQMQEDMLSPQHQLRQQKPEQPQQQPQQAHTGHAVASAEAAVTTCGAKVLDHELAGSSTASIFPNQLSSDMTVSDQVFELSSSVSHMELDGACEQEAAAGSSHTDSLEWYNEELLQAGAAGDLAQAQGLWLDMQQQDVKPSLITLNNFLLCWHYGGGNPQEAEQVVNEMCTAADIVPDSATGHYLAAIDMGWQQLEFAAGM